MGLRDLVYEVYERRLAGRLEQIDRSRLPRHVGVILDGNRRWARGVGDSPPRDGHQAGADKIEEFLGWCEESDVEVVTLWLLSTDNLTAPGGGARSRCSAIIEETVRDLAERRRWRIHPVGALDLLPGAPTATRSRRPRRPPTDIDGHTVNVAVGYGGRREIADAVRSLLQEHADQGTSLDDLAEVLDVDHIAAHLYTKGQPDPDLVIRTSGEQRLSGFLLWQSAHSEFYFCEAYWPAFRRIDFLRALRVYAARHRRFGG